MNRSHRLLREVHALRKGRFAVAQNREFYEPFVEIKAFAQLTRDLHGDGYLDREATLDGTVAIIDVLMASWLPNVLPAEPSGS